MKKMSLDDIKKIAVVGLGYVGLPVAVEFSKKFNVIGYDIDNDKIEKLRKGIDSTGEIDKDESWQTRVEWTSDAALLSDAQIIIVTVPTPVSFDNIPDLSMLRHASEIVGQNLSKGTTVIFESTVYPGVIEDVCIPVLEMESNLAVGDEFKVGYSPERINPGDKIHRFTTTKKIVSGIDKDSLDLIATLYQTVIKNDIYKAPSIKVAEAAKLIENCQRDINIAFVNELSIIFDKLGIDTLDVLKAAETKWNFMPFKPGLVGGHCIGVDPYYLTYCAEEAGYHSQVILSGRKTNDSMGKYIAEQTVKLLSQTGIPLNQARVGCLGITFKENCNDIRNSKVVDIINELREYGMDPIVFDPLADPEKVKCVYQIDLVSQDDLHDLDCIIIAVAHDVFKMMSDDRLNQMFSSDQFKKVLIDVKGIRSKEANREKCYWRL